MSMLTNPEYRQLATDTSNEMIEHDADRGLGRYVEAALHIREAGLGRVRMGQLAYDAGDYPRAAADWLSAAACFYLVPDLMYMRQRVEQVRQLDREGKIPADRRDIHAALKEREEQLGELDSRLKRFWQDYGQMVGPMRTASQDSLSFLLRQVRELPGSPHLHAEISGQALQLGQKDLAVQSLECALRIDPGNPQLTALRASQLFDLGDSVRAAQVARDALAVHPEVGSLRILLAQALAFRAGPSGVGWKPEDWEEAIDVLRPLIENASANPVERLNAISLAATLRHGLGQETEYHRLLSIFDTLATTVSSPIGREVVTRLRRGLSQVVPQPVSVGNAPSARFTLVLPDLEPLLQVA